MTRAENNTVVPGPIVAAALQCPQCGDNLPLKKGSNEEQQNGILLVAEHCNGTAKVQVRDFIVSWEKNKKAQVPTISELRAKGGLGLKRTAAQTKQIEKEQKESPEQQRVAKQENENRNKLMQRRNAEAEGRTEEDKEAQKAAREAEKEEQKQKQEQRKAAQEEQKELEKDKREAAKQERKQQNKNNNSKEE